MAHLLLTESLNLKAEDSTHETEKIVDLKNHIVNFRICDIFYPDYQQLLFGLHGNDVLRGRVIDLSQTGEIDSSFAEIEVHELEHRVIVPIDRILGICE